jgi:hypothetical protein
MFWHKNYVHIIYSLFHLPTLKRLYPNLIRIIKGKTNICYFLISNNVVTDLIIALPGNSPVNTVQHATIEEDMFSVYPTERQLTGWIAMT